MKTSDKEFEEMRKVEHPPISLECSTRMAMEKVECNDALLICILVGLPPKSVFKFRCVSKRWKSIISEPFFLECYSSRTRNGQQHCSLGRILAFMEDVECYGNDKCSHSPINILPVKPTEDYNIKQIPRRFGTYIGSSGGLVLCGEDFKPGYVVNPLTRNWVSLPPPLNINHTLRYGFASEENTAKLVPIFSVVGIDMMDSEVEAKTMQIETYSSQTRKWTTSNLIGTENFIRDDFEEPYVSNGVFHWPTGTQSLAVYDAKEDANHIQLINLPVGELEYLTRSSDNDVIWVGTLNTSESLQFWMLPKNEHGCYKRDTTIAATEWILIHTVSMNSLRKCVMSLLRNEKRKKIGSCSVAKIMPSRLIRIQALIPCNPVVVVLSQGKRLFLYNLKSKHIELVQYVDNPIAEHSHVGWYPYIESLSLSSYACLGNTY